MKTRTGKIARLPKPIREQLNQRLENGEPGTSLVAWLNQLPEVQKIIAEQFDGRPIRPQNLSEWRKGGYIDWLRHQLLREQTRWTAEQAAELGLDTTGKSISIAEDIATVMSAELALHVQALGNIKNPRQRFDQFRRLSRELSRLRQDDQRVIRNQLRHPGRLHLDPQHSAPVGRDPVEPKLPPPASTPEPAILDPQPSPLPSAGGASVPASRAQPATCAGKTTQPATPAGAPVDRASVPDCGSPLPLSETLSTPPAPKPEQPAVPENVPPPSSSCIQPSSLAENVPYNPPLPAVPMPQPSAPIRVNPHRNYYDPRPPIRGRRFVCIEG